MARLNVRNRVQRGFWRALEAVGVKDARRAGRAQSPFLQRAVPPLVIAALVLVLGVGGGGAATSDVLALLAIVYVLYLLPRRARRIALPLTVLGDCHRLPDPVGERAQRNQRLVRDSGLQGVPEHGHDGRDRHLRDDGDRPEHRRRLRGPARSRLRRLLRDRRLHGGLVRLSALLLGRLRVRRDRRAAGRRRHPHLDLARPHRRRSITAVAGVLIGLPTLRLRGDYLAIVTLGFGEIIHQAALNGDADGISALLDRRRTSTSRTARSGSTRSIRRASAAGCPTSSGCPANFIVENGSYVNFVQLSFYWSAIGLLLITVFCSLRLRDSRLGRAWIAIREDEVAAAAMGIPLMRTKTWSYASGAFFGGVAGAWYGSLQAGRLPRRLPLQLLDLHPLHGHPRRDGERVGRDRRRG